MRVTHQCGNLVSATSLATTTQPSWGSNNFQTKASLCFKSLIYLISYFAVSCLVSIAAVPPCFLSLRAFGEKLEGRGEILWVGSWWLSPQSSAGPRVLLPHTADVFYRKYIPLSSSHPQKNPKSQPNDLGKEAVSVWNRKGDDGVKILPE